MKAAPSKLSGPKRRVPDYFDRHLDSDLELETVSRVAAFSKFHVDRRAAAVCTGT